MGTNLASKMLSERSRSPKIIYHVILFICNVQSRLTLETESSLVVLTS